MFAHVAQGSRRFAPILVGLTIALLLIWSPWMTPAIAAQRVESAFATVWDGIADGCGLVGPAGPVTIRLVGYTTEITYACGMLPSNSPEFHKHTVVYISPLGTVHGLPRP